MPDQPERHRQQVFGALVAALGAVVAAETALAGRRAQPAASPAVTPSAAEAFLPAGPCCPPCFSSPAGHAALTGHPSPDGVALATGAE